MPTLLCQFDPIGIPDVPPKMSPPHPHSPHGRPYRCYRLERLPLSHRSKDYSISKTEAHSISGYLSPLFSTSNLDSCEASQIPSKGHLQGFGQTSFLAESEEVSRHCPSLF